MKRSTTFFLLFCIMAAAAADFVIQKAQLKDFAEIIYVDADVSFTYFTEVWRRGYAHYFIGQQTEAILQELLESDIQVYPHILTNQTERSIFIARDSTTNRILAFLDVQPFEHDTNVILLELFCVLSCARGKGIGRALIEHVIKEYPAADGILVFPVKHANEATLQFYRAIGFKVQPLPDTSLAFYYDVPSQEMFLCMYLPIEKGLLSQ